MTLEEEIAIVNAVVLTPEQEASIDAAMKLARDFYEYELAVSARYVAKEDLLLVVLKSGRRLAIPVEDLQGLAGADRSLVARVEVSKPYGDALHWEELDVDFSVVGLGERRLGNERWMAGLAQRRRDFLELAS